MNEEKLNNKSNFLELNDFEQAEELVYEFYNNPIRSKKEIYEELFNLLKKELKE